MVSNSFYSVADGVTVLKGCFGKVIPNDGSVETEHVKQSSEV